MGVVRTITHNSFPPQGDKVGRRISVCYHYNADFRHGGIIIRDDMAEPFETILQLDNGRFIRAVECHYSFED